MRTAMRGKETEEEAEMYRRTLLSGGMEAANSLHDPGLGGMLVEPSWPKRATGSLPPIVRPPPGAPPPPPPLVAPPPPPGVFAPGARSSAPPAPPGVHPPRKPDAAAAAALEAEEEAARIDAEIEMQEVETAAAAAADAVEEDEFDYASWPISELRRILEECGGSAKGIVDKHDLVDAALGDA